ncbi:MAG: hypothetical protein H6555_06085 [Lewinellaceae bacterium]|nr:hypothetical protein [Lewinellaceae bacterium]
MRSSRGVPFIWSAPFVIAKVRFGQTTQRCRGTGICAVEFQAQQDNIIGASGGCKCERAAALVVQEPDRLVFKFYRAELCPQAYQRQFASGVFKMEESYTLPASVSQRLSRKQIQIAAGTYPVEENEQFIIVAFPNLSECGEIYRS